MRKMIATFILLALFRLLPAPGSHCLNIIEAHPIEPFKVIWQATCKVESNFNPYAIGDHNLKNKAYGIAQIRKPRLDDYYIKTGIRYSENDMFDVEKSKEIFMYYCVQFHTTQLQEISRCWNGGDRGMDKRSTIVYWNKVKRYL